MRSFCWMCKYSVKLFFQYFFYFMRKWNNLLAVTLQIVHWTVFSAIAEIFFVGGLFYGLPAHIFILKEEGVYSELCESQNQDRLKNLSLNSCWLFFSYHLWSESCILEPFDRQRVSHKMKNSIQFLSGAFFSPPWEVTFSVWYWITMDYWLHDYA